MNRLPKRLLHRSPLVSSRSSQLAYFSRATSIRQKVQTPIQSQNKNDITPELRPAEGTFVQTPVQSQGPSAVTPDTSSTSTKQKRDLLPLYTLFGGLALGSVFVYYHYGYRKEHMQKKWDKMVQEAQESRKAGR